MDQYHSGSSESVDLILSILIEMLDKTHIIQKHAFDLLFNLSIHANLFEDPKIQRIHSFFPLPFLFLFH